MSIDYDASYGLGYEVSEPEWFEDKYCDEDYCPEFNEWLESELGECADIQKIGSDYSCETETIITIARPLKYGLDLTKAKQELDDELKRLNIEPDGDFQELGGVLIS